MRFFIANQPLVGVRVKKLGNQFVAHCDIELERGSLLKTVDDAEEVSLRCSGIKGFANRQQLILQTCDTQNVFVACKRDAVDVAIGSANGSAPPDSSDRLEVGDRIVWIDEKRDEYGTVRWLGRLQNEVDDYYAGVEFDNPIGSGTGIHAPSGRQLFACRPNHASFVPVIGLIKAAEFRRNDSAALSNGKLKPSAKFYVPLNGLDQCDSAASTSATQSSPPANFGPKDSGEVRLYVGPMNSLPLGNVIGLSRGIQGAANSCYLDASLFAMFAFTDSFDRLLLRRTHPTDIPEYDDFMNILATEIVFPLRQKQYVRADHVMKLRRLLSRLLYDVPGLVDAEKDPEEVLTGMFKKVMQVEPFLRLNSKEAQLRDSYFCQLVIEEKLELSFPTVQQLMESSFFAQGLKFTRVPQNLIVHVPRYGRTKIYPQVFPNLELDLTHLIQDRPRPCVVCGKLAAVECSECFLTRPYCSLNDVTYCAKCFDAEHPEKSGKDHGAKGIVARSIYKYYDEHDRAAIVRTKVSLSAVLCIETSHYVAYVKSGKGDSQPWLFFDSMADREGEADGYCIPEVRVCPDLQMYLKEENFSKLSADLDLGSKALPPYLLRLVKDAYVCFYENRMIPN